MVQRSARRSVRAPGARTSDRTRPAGCSFVPSVAGRPSWPQEGVSDLLAGPFGRPVPEAQVIDAHYACSYEAAHAERNLGTKVPVDVTTRGRHPDIPK